MTSGSANLAEDGLEEALRRANRARAVPVFLLTAVDSLGEFHGLAVTSCGELPGVRPALMVAINRSASAWPAVLQSKQFCLNGLHVDQVDLLDPFCHPHQRERRFRGDGWDVGPGGLPWLRTALSNLFCEIAAIHFHGEHALCIGNIFAAVAADETCAGEPLIWRNGAALRLRQ